MSIFSNRLESERKSAGWTKTDTAKRLRLPLTTYANYEYGSREPDIETIKKIAELFGTTTDYLMGKTDQRITDSYTDIPTDADLDEALDNAHSFDGKPMDEHDRKIIKNLLKGYFAGKE